MHWLGLKVGCPGAARRHVVSFAGVTEQALVLVFCLSPAIDSVDGEVVLTVPSLASASSPSKHGAMLCPGAALRLPSPLCLSSLAVRRGMISI